LREAPIDRKHTSAPREMLRQLGMTAVSRWRNIELKWNATANLVLEVVSEALVDKARGMLKRRAFAFRSP
jgi:hypothetical protein